MGDSAADIFRRAKKSDMSIEEAEQRLREIGSDAWDFDAMMDVRAGDE